MELPPDHHISSDRWPLIGHSFLLTVNNSQMSAPQMLVTKRQPPLTFSRHQTNMWQNDQYLNSPYVPVLHQKVTKSQPYVHVGPHLRLPRKGIHTCMRKIVFHMLIAPKSEAENSNNLKLRTRKVTDGSPLTHKVAYGCQMVIQGQGCFTKCGLPQMILPVV